jgi:hypothetical protein
MSALLAAALNIAPDLAQPIYSTEDRATVNAGRCGPFFDCSRSANRIIVLALERFDVFLCAIPGGLLRRTSMVVGLEPYGLEPRF